MHQSRVKIRFLAYVVAAVLLLAYCIVFIMVAEAAIGSPLRESGLKGLIAALLAIVASLILWLLTLVVGLFVLPFSKPEPSIDDPIILLPKSQVSNATWGNLEPE